MFEGDSGAKVGFQGRRALEVASPQGKTEHCDDDDDGVQEHIHSSLDGQAMSSPLHIGAGVAVPADSEKRSLRILRRNGKWA